MELILFSNKIFKKFSGMFGFQKQKNDNDRRGFQNWDQIEPPIQGPILQNNEPYQNFRSHPPPFPDSNNQNFDGMRGMGYRGGRRGRGRYFRGMMHAFQNDHEDDHKHKHHKHHHGGHKKKEKLSTQEKIEDIKKKLVVISQHDITIDAQIGQYVTYNIIVQNLSNKNVPKNTYLVKDEEYDESLIDFEPINITDQDKIHSLVSKNIMMRLKMPTNPGEYI